MSTPNIKEVVREKYGQAALRIKSGAGNSCCGDPSALEASCDPITSNLYDAAQEDEVPDTAIQASFGCGNPIRANKPAATACCAPGCCS
jgi:arsenite methyltransferase